MTSHPSPGRHCLRDAIPEIADAARYLDAAVAAHFAGLRELAQTLIRLADMPAIREWTDSLWGKNSPYTKAQRSVGRISADTMQLATRRAPNAATKVVLLERDGYHCRFCGIPVIRAEIRARINLVYPQALSWGNSNIKQHAAFQAMWVQYDHIVPFKRGGSSCVDNLVVTCAPCNFARMDHTLDEVALTDPRSREPVRSTWDGLERFSIA